MAFKNPCHAELEPESVIDLVDRYLQLRRCLLGCDVDLPQIVGALDAVFELAEDLAYLVFDGVRPGGFLLEAVQEREQFLIDEGEQVVAAQSSVVVDLAVFALRCCPAFPAVWIVEDVGVCDKCSRSERNRLGCDHRASVLRARWCSVEGLLPFIDQKELFEQYHFDQPWDSEQTLGCWK